MLRLLIHVTSAWNALKMDASLCVLKKTHFIVVKQKVLDSFGYVND